MLSKGERTYYLKKTKEHYKILDFPIAELKNLIYGEKYVFFRGPLIIKNLTTGDILEMNFPGHTWTG